MDLKVFEFEGIGRNLELVLSRLYPRRGTADLKATASATDTSKNTCLRICDPENSSIGESDYLVVFSVILWCFVVFCGILLYFVVCWWYFVVFGCILLYLVVFGCILLYFGGVLWYSVVFGCIWLYLVVFCSIL